MSIRFWVQAWSATTLIWHRFRKTEAIEGISTVLDFQEAGDFRTILFTGHRGCGKSTELQRIRRQWETDYKVIYLEANEETDINNAEYNRLLSNCDQAG